MSEAIDRLLEEHGAIKRMMQVTDKVCKRLKAGGKIPSEHLDQIMEFYLVFADQCHHEKEEQGLFPVLEAAGVPVEGGPIGVMLTDHKMLRGCMERMGKAVARYKEGNERAAAMIAQNAINHDELLLMHISKEENVLFPLAEAQLTEAQKAEVAARFEGQESGKIGPGRHEAFLKTLDRLEAAYLQG